MNTERWFISYRCEVKEFLAQKARLVKHSNTVVDVTPARWMLEHGNKYNILYAERISQALASELIHSGAGIHAEYF